VSYLVRIVSGPAEGWEYVTMVPPDETIAVAPAPRSSAFVWFRVHVEHGEEAWPGQENYRRGELPDETIAVPFERLSVEGDIIVEYEHAG
jgi:hypothetical protein